MSIGIIETLHFSHIQAHILSLIMLKQLSIVMNKKDYVIT